MLQQALVQILSDAQEYQDVLRNMDELLRERGLKRKVVPWFGTAFTWRCLSPPGQSTDGIWGE